MRESSTVLDLSLSIHPHVLQVWQLLFVFCTICVGRFAYEMDGRSYGLHIVSAFTWDDQSDIAMTLQFNKRLFLKQSLERTSCVKPSLALEKPLFSC